MSVLLEFSIYPVDKGESLSEHVAKSLDIIDKSGVKYQLTPMGTVLEGEWDEVMAVVTECYEEMRKYSNRIACSIKIDYRKGREDGLTEKVESVQQKVGRELKT